MNAKIVIVVALFALLCIAEAKKKGKGKGMKCKGEDVKMSDDVKDAFKTCKDEIKNKDNEDDDADSAEKKKNRKKKIGCFTACVMEKTKTVADGKVDTDAVNKWVESTYPSAVQSDLKDALKKCADDAGTLSKDDDCETYGKYGKCKMQAIKKACKSDKKKDADSD